jgi:hypothetical protein
MPILIGLGSSLTASKGRRVSSFQFQVSGSVFRITNFGFLLCFS